MCYGSLVSYCLPFISPISSFITGFLDIPVLVRYLCSDTVFVEKGYVPIYIIDTE